MRVDAACGVKCDVMKKGDEQGVHVASLLISVAMLACRGPKPGPNKAGSV